MSRIPRKKKKGMAVFKVGFDSIEWNKIKKILLVLAVVVVGLLAFIKFDTQAAAQLTDNVLRPILGPDVVIFLEKIYFNLTDKVQGIIYSDKTVQAPSYLTQPGDFG